MTLNDLIEIAEKLDYDFDKDLYVCLRDYENGSFQFDLLTGLFQDSDEDITLVPFSTKLVADEVE